MELHIGGISDLDILTTMNQQLIEDEHSNNTMSIEELRDRMKYFLETEYRAYLFYEKAVLVGYALVHMKKQPYFLRQFFICRDQRRKGYGKTAIYAILKQLDVENIDIEVLSENKKGIAFWQSCGFTEYSRYMKLKWSI